jgi:hypothetical protein
MTRVERRAGDRQRMRYAIGGGKGFALGQCQGDYHGSEERNLILGP